jgi:undecaprenyl-diphosphatase
VFDTAIHMATALAAIIHMRRTWFAVLGGSVGALRAGSPWASEDFRVLVWVAVATVPAAAVGVVFHDFLSSLFEMPRLAAAMLFVTAGLLVVAERVGRGRRPLHELGAGRATAVGVGQAIAIIPAISRSGATIAAGQLCGLDRESATRFSFLMAAPILLGSGVFEALQNGSQAVSRDEWTAIAAGSAAAFIVGFASIGWLLRYVNRHTLLPFALYTAVLGAVGLIVLR